MKLRDMEEVLVYAAHTGRWEIATREENTETGAIQWERTDGSYICDEGDEIAVLPLPSAPIGGIRESLTEALAMITTHVEDDAQHLPHYVLVLEALTKITSKEWDYVRKLLATEIDCNENPLAVSVLKKLNMEGAR